MSDVIALLGGMAMNKGPPHTYLTHLINTVRTHRANGPGRRGRPKKSWELCRKKNVRGRMTRKDTIDY